MTTATGIQKLCRGIFTILPLSFAVFCAAAASAQTPSLGVKVGVPMTDYFDTGATGSLHGSAAYTSGTRRYTFGLSGEVRMKGGLGVEIDALYHRMNYSGVINTFDSATGNFSRATIGVFGNSWDFPVMLKYRMGKVIHPYVDGGFVLRWISSARENGYAVTGTPFVTNPASSIGTNDPTDLRKSLYPGVTIGGGVEVPVLKFRVLPEIRYTHWTSNIGSDGALLRFEPNQAEFLLGVSF